MDKFRVQGQPVYQVSHYFSAQKMPHYQSCSAILAEEPVELTNVPKLKDIDTD